MHPKSIKQTSRLVLKIVLTLTPHNKNCYTKQTGEGSLLRRKRKQNKNKK